MDSRAEATSDPSSSAAVAHTDQAGSPGSRTFRQLFHDEFGGMVALARLLGSDDPENTAQEAFVRLHSRWDSLHDPAAAVGYLRTSVVRLSRNRLRHLAVVRRHARTEHPGDHTPAESAEADALQRADVQAVRSALDRLPAARRAALVLRFYADLPYDEIAEALRCPAATARSHVRRGLAELARLLGERNDDSSNQGERR